MQTPGNLVALNAAARVEAAQVVPAVIQDSSDVMQ
jgi:hypothetical protein